MQTNFSFKNNKIEAYGFDLEDNSIFSSFTFENNTIEGCLSFYNNSNSTFENFNLINNFAILTTKNFFMEIYGSIDCNFSKWFLVTSLNSGKGKLFFIFCEILFLFYIFRFFSFRK